ncbi:MAG: hypothetical protein IRY99_22255, partial [Isosphaeraceae bacterium]|nr:hypothetical protein [Isosphaeraceae bacterium]
LRRPTRPPAPAEPTDATYSALGLELRTLDETTAGRLNLPATARGVVVVRVDPHSPLATAIRPWDLLNTVGGRPVRTAEEAARALSARVGRGPLDLGLQRWVNGSRQPLTVQIP